MSIQTSDIQLKVNDKIANAYLATPQNGGPGVLVLHAWWGLKPFFKQVCDQLAKQGFHRTRTRSVSGSNSKNN